MNARLFAFCGGVAGPWRVTRMSAIVGDGLPAVRRIAITPGTVDPSNEGTGWVLRGIMSNERYVQRDEKDRLLEKQEGLGRVESTCAALIPIRKNASWWALTQDERRRIIEEQSRHIRIGLEYLPAIARRLHHCRDLSENEPFDFLTWFEFAPAHEADFNRLLVELRASLEWTYVDREVDVRLIRD